MGPTIYVAICQPLPTGIAQVIAVDPFNSTILYAGTRSGIYKSTNGGLAWINVGLTNQSSFSDLKFDPSNSATLFAAAGGLFKTTDSGLTWKQLASGATYALAIPTSNPLTVFRASDGVYKSTDGGQSWIAASAGIGTASVYVLVDNPSDPNTLFAATASDLYVTHDSGQNWVISSNGLTGRVYSLVFDPVTSTNIWAGTVSGLFTSTDGGQSWTSVNSDLPVTRIVFDPFNPSTIYMAGGRSTGTAYRSIDRGRTWTAADAGLPAAFLGWVTNSIIVDRAIPCTLYAASGNDTIYKSVDCSSTWFPANSGINALDISGVLVDPMDSATVYVGTRGAGLFKSANGGIDWPVSYGVSGSTNAFYPIVMDPLTNSTIYAIHGGTTIMKTTNAGLTWKSIRYPASGIALDPNNPSIIYSGYSNSGRAQRSTDAGESWSLSNIGLPAQLANSLVVDPANSSVVYAGYPSGLYKSIDYGQNWFLIRTGYVAFLCFDHNTPANLYVGAFNTLNRTDDGGQNWSIVSGHSLAYLYGIAFDPSNINMFYVWGNGGIAKTLNGGSSWTVQNSGFLTSDAVEALAIDPSNPNTLYAGTTRNGLYKSTDAGASWLHPPLPCAIDVTSSTNIYRSGLRFLYREGTFVQNEYVFNVSSKLLKPPLSLVLDGLSPYGILQNAAGKTQCVPPLGSPFVDSPLPLLPSQGINFLLSFKNLSTIWRTCQSCSYFRCGWGRWCSSCQYYSCPTYNPINYQLRILSGLSR